MRIATQKRYYTPEEYLELEEKAEFRSEYRNGEIIPTTGGTTNHNKIAGNFYSYLKSALRGKDYEIYIADVRLWLPRYQQYTYPDVMVIQGEPVYAGTNTTTVTNPSLIVEVLSKFTKNYDQGDKFHYYRSIPEFQEYILIDQHEYHVMQYVKTAADQWLFTELESDSATLSLNTVDLQISIPEIYEKVNFSDSNDEE
ncbi:Uma2 family endonuclease [Anabaena sp. CCY 9910]|uniref:Uma2 family endonuclease n=1 Tax=Anabaena sp. CCY 9910 TaxID=3103870 RepID=UPI0039E1818A